MPLPPIIMTSTQASTRSRLWFVLVGLVLVLATGCYWGYKLYTAPIGRHTEVVYLLIDRESTPQEVRAQLHKKIWPVHPRVFDFFWSYRGVDERLRAGRYAIPPETTADSLMKILIYGAQAPVRISLRGLRTEAELVGQLDKYLMLDSAEIVRFFADSVSLQARGLDREQARSLFLADEYKLLWDSSLDQLIDSLTLWHDSFWTADRRARADSLGLRPHEVSALAAILEEESGKPDEYPRIAGLYLNRLRRGMPLQSDPTIKFALGAFGLRRILHEHLAVDSPYNTYRYTGLTPGPIRLVKAETLEAVLAAEHHAYLYMCAREDFSGYHSFAESYAVHLGNARRYQQELNRRGIKR